MGSCYIKMSDIFDQKILCKNCNKEMEKIFIVRNGFKMRALTCKKCGNKLVHPKDEQEYKKFLNLRNKVYKVKLRIVGNSYAISIPKEIVQFINRFEKEFNDLVKLTFEDARRLRLMFD